MKNQKERTFTISKTTIFSVHDSETNEILHNFPVTKSKLILTTSEVLKKYKKNSNLLLTSKEQSILEILAIAIDNFIEN